MNAKENNYFKIGDFVAVKSGYCDKERNVNCSFWQGDIIRIDNENSALIQWSEFTIDQMPVDYLANSSEKNIDVYKSYVPMSELLLLKKKEEQAKAKRAVRAKILAIESKSRIAINLAIEIIVAILGFWQSLSIINEKNALGELNNFSAYSPYECFVLILGSIIISIIFFGILRSYKYLRLRNELDSSAKKSEAIIIDKYFEGARNRSYFIEYKFDDYSLSQRLSSSKYNAMEIGDRIEIKYLEENPNISSMF